MHEYQFDSSLRRGSSLKRSIALSRREVSFEPEKRKKKKKSSKEKDSSQPSSSHSSQVLILTSSSRPSTSKHGATKSELSARILPTFKPIPASQFYEKPKSILEKQYEKNLQKFVPVDTSDDFLALESSSDLVENDYTKTSLGASLNIPSPSATIEEPELTFQDIVLDTTQEQEFHVTYFINASDAFLRKAHSLVLGSNDLSGARTYYSLVRLALKALHILINEYSSSLNPLLESAIYHKLGAIYLKETQALEKAEHFVNMAIALASKHNLSKLKVISEFLYCEILEQINSQTLSLYVVEKLELYRKEGLTNIADLYSLLRSNHLLLGASSLSLKSLNPLSLNPEANPCVRCLSLLNEASTHLYRGSFKLAKESITRAREIIPQTNCPSQLVALSHLTSLSLYVQSSDSVAGKAIVLTMGEFIGEQRKSEWIGWRDDGSFSLSVPLFESDAETSSFEVQWLNSNEFIILFYFLNGMLDLHDRSSFDRTKKVFASCLEIINMQLEQLTALESDERNFRISFLTDKIVRLSFIRYSVIYYKIWVEFLHESNFSGVFSVQYFIECFDGDKFTKEEMCYYNLLVPKFLYLAAIYYQSQGNLSSAKYYFLRIRNLSQTNCVDSVKVSTIQKNLGIGCELLLPKAEASELHLFSTLHLCFIVEYDLFSISKSKSAEKTCKSKALASHALLGNLLSDLNRYFDGKEGEISESFGKSSLAYFTYKMVLLSHHAKEFSNGSNVQLADHLSEIELLKSKNSFFGYMETLASYILYKYSTNIEMSNDMLRQIIVSMVDSEENSQFVGLLILADQDARNALKASKAFAGVEQTIFELKRIFQGRLELAEISSHLS